MQMASRSMYFPSSARIFRTPLAVVGMDCLRLKTWSVALSILRLDDAMVLMT